MKGLLVTLILASFFSGCAAKKSQDANSSNVVAGNLYAKGSEVGNHSNEAVMNFDYFVWVAADEFQSTVSYEAMEATFREKIDKQIQHLFGSFKAGKYEGVPKLGTSQKVTILKSSLRYDKENAEYQVKYHYTGNALVDDGFGSVVKLAIPKNPDYIYLQAKGNFVTNTCTDPHYNSEGDFWYFWNVSMCDTIQDGVDYDLVSIKLTKIPNTTKTFPDYNGLVRTDKDGKRKVTLYAFYGAYEEMDYIQDDISNVDLVSDTFKQANANIQKMGFKAKKAYRLGDSAILFNYEKFIPKTNVTLEVKMFFGNTGIDEKDNIQFYKLYKEALQSGSILFYGGHSGLGGNLDVDMIEGQVGKIKFDVNHYQIMFFDSCSSFPYYTQMYFNKKIGLKDAQGKVDRIGTKNFDIITNGLSSYFVRNSASITSLVSVMNIAFEKGQALSWQQSIDFIHAKQVAIEPSLGGHMLSVSGDEDNATVAPIIKSK